MAVKSKHGAGGEYAPDWKPKAVNRHAEIISFLADGLVQVEQPPAPEALPPPEDAASAGPAKPAWRTVNKKAIAHKKEPKSLPAPAPAPPPMPEVKQMPAWATWKRTLLTPYSPLTFPTLFYLIFLYI